jgi:AcrR family transcriptional regulator
MALEPLTPERRRALTREHLLAAAADVFARRGYHSATLDEVAEAAGFSKGAVYSNFASKEDLFLALSRQREQEMIEAFGAAGAASEDPAKLFTALRDVYVASRKRDDAWALWTEFMLFSLRDPEARPKLVESNRAGHDLVVALVERQCEDDGVIPSVSPELIARMYGALFTGLWQQQALDPDAVDDDAFAAAIVFMRQAITALGKPRRTTRKRKA